MIGELKTEGREYNIGFPILAGFDVLASKSMDVLSLPEATLRSGLAFHYAILTEPEREWVNRIIASMPSLAAEALTAYWRPQLVRNLKNINGLYDLARNDEMKSVAQHGSLALLKDNPNIHEDNLELLLHAALRNVDRQELLLCGQHVLANHSTLSDENRALWFAASFAIDHDSVKSGLVGHIRDKPENAARVLNFLCPSLGTKSEAPYPLSNAALASLITMTGPILPPQNMSETSYVATRSPVLAADSIRSLIHRLGRDLTWEASLALADLEANPALAAWRFEIAYVMADQARQRREHAFQYPSVDQVIETLKEGRPANAADLQALVDSHLQTIKADLQDGPTDGWKRMWNVDSFGKPTHPRPENDCRDRLLDLLRPRLFSVGVAAEPEGHYAEDKRADIKAIIGAINLPVEIKRHYHSDLWTAPREQLKKLYARDPGTAGRGIYLVFWFGTDEGRSLPKHPTGCGEIHKHVELEKALLDTLQPAEKELLQIIVIDCARRSSLKQSSSRVKAQSAQVQT
jgi:hypothetical protein